MLILHRRLRAGVSHGLHHQSQVAGRLKQLSAVVVPATVENKPFWQPSFASGLTKFLIHGSQSPPILPWDGEQPALGLSGGTNLQNVHHAVGYRYESSPRRRLAVGDEDRCMIPVDVLDANGEKLLLRPHARISNHHGHIPHTVMLLQRPTSSPELTESKRRAISAPRPHPACQCGQIPSSA